MPKILLSNIRDNNYRDRNLFPTSPAKISAIEESVNQTGFWDNIMVRLLNNELSDGTVITDHEQLSELLIDGSIDLQAEIFELAYGHHRLDALVNLGFTEIDIPVKFITDEDMLRIMSNENKEGWGSSIKSILETVRQVKGQLVSMFDDYAGYNDYISLTGKDKIVFSKKQFQEAKLNGIGYRTVQAFLGDSWNATDVRIPMACFKAVEKGYFKQEEIFNFPSLGILDAFTAMAVSLYEGGRVKEKVSVEKKDKEGKTVRDDNGDPVMVKKDKFVTVTAPNWPVALKKKMLKAVMDQCLPAEIKDDNDEDAVEYIKETLLTQSEIMKRRINMLKKQSAPTTGGAAEYKLKKEIVRAYFPGFDPSCPDDERDNLHAQLVGKDMENFINTDGIEGWSALDGMVAELKEDFSVLKAPVSEVVEDLQTSMDQEAGTSEDFESDYKDLDIKLETEGEAGENVAVPIGQLSCDIVDLLNVAMTGVDGLTDRAEEIDIEQDEALKDTLTIAIAKLANLYHSVTDTDTLGYMLREILESADLGMGTDEKVA